MCTPCISAPASERKTPSSIHLTDVTSSGRAHALIWCQNRPLHEQGGDVQIPSLVRAVSGPLQRVNDFIEKNRH